MQKKKTRRADGRYQGKLLVGTLDGKNQYRYVYGKTQKEVNDKLAALRVELGRGVDLTQDRRLSFWIDRWLRRAERTQTDDWHAMCDVRAQLWRDRLGSADITRLTAADLEDVLLDLAARNPRTGKPSSKKTLTEYRSVIRRVLAYALQNRVITFNPADGIEIRKDAPKTTREALTDAQIAAIRETSHEAQLPCLIMIYAGLRLGELAALTWSDVDLAAGTISVNKAMHFGSATFKPPKTAAGVRTVPIPDVLHPFLLSAPRASLFVCPHRGAAYTTGSWRRTLEGYLRQLGFTTSAHCLRHTYCTLLYEAGVDVIAAKELMGHADVATTMKIYTHLRETHKTSSVARLNDYLSRAATAPQPAQKA